LAEEIFDDGELIDETGFQKIANKAQRALDRLPRVIYKNNKGKETKRVDSFNGKNLQIVGGVVELDPREKNDRSISINVKFAEPFSGRHPAVVPMIETGGQAYGVSVSDVTPEGFVMNIRHFADGETYNLKSIMYVAVGLP
jgi:hypothetical protein